MSEVVLGCQAKDRVTGFRGTVTGFCEYLSGCNQFLLVPSVGDDGAYKEGHWFDVQRVDRISEDVITLDNSQTPGPDLPAPKY